MNVDRAVLAFAGAMVLASALLAWAVSPYWLLLTAFVGANMVQAAFTGFLPGSDDPGQARRQIRLRLRGLTAGHPGSAAGVGRQSFAETAAASAARRPTYRKAVAKNVRVACRRRGVRVTR